MGELEQKSKMIAEQEKINKFNKERADKHAKMITENSTRIEENIIKSPPKSPTSLYKMDRANLAADVSKKLLCEDLE